MFARNYAPKLHCNPHVYSLHQSACCQHSLLTTQYIGTHGHRSSSDRLNSMVYSINFFFLCHSLSFSSSVTLSIINLIYFLSLDSTKKTAKAMNSKMISAVNKREHRNQELVIAERKEKKSEKTFKDINWTV